MLVLRWQDTQAMVDRLNAIGWQTAVDSLGCVKIGKFCPLSAVPFDILAKIGRTVRSAAVATEAKGACTWPDSCLCTEAALKRNPN
jgi:hypothetical protein